MSCCWNLAETYPAGFAKLAVAKIIIVLTPEGDTPGLWIVVLKDTVVGSHQNATLRGENCISQHGLMAVGSNRNFRYNH